MKANSFVYDRLRLHLYCTYPIFLSIVVIDVKYVMQAEIVILFSYLFMYNKKYAKTSRLANKYNYTKNPINTLNYVC